MSSSIAATSRSHTGQPEPLSLEVNYGTMSSSSVGVIAKVRPVLDEIRDALRPVVEEAGGVVPRASAMARDLGIDKTLSARILRALKPTDVATVVYEVPSPEGLRIFLNAAQRVGVKPSSGDRVARAIRDFERLIAEFPGGRGALNAAFAGLSPATRDHTERAAKQAIYKAMSLLLGFSCDVSQATFLIRRNREDSAYADTAYVLGKHGVRRLRASHAITMFGRTLLPARADEPERVVSRTLDGRISERSSDYLLEDFCSQPLPRMDTVNTQTALLNVLPEGVPSVNESVSLVSGQLVRRSTYLDATGEYPTFEAFTPRMPSKVLVLDALVEEDLFAGPPILATTLHSLNGVPVAPGNPAFNLDEVSLQAPMQHLSRGLSQLGVVAIPRYDVMIERVMSILGWDASRFVGYRTVVRYPVPVVNIAYWFPKRGGGG